MHDEYKYMLLKYAASVIENNVDIYNCKEDVFKIQEIYSKESKVNITFCPIMFFATYINEILNIDDIIIEYDKYNKVPITIKLHDLILFTQYKMNNLHCTILYIRYYIKFKLKTFNTKAYYSQYYDVIDNKYNNSKLSIDKITALFYTEYGYWNKLNIKYINPFQYICSYPDLINLNENEALQTFFKFENDERNKLLFDPYIYVASNIDQLKFLIDDEFNLPNCNNELRIFKQYIRDGFNKKLKINTFDSYAYLANNHKEIKNILNEDNCIYWDIHKLSKRNIAIHYIKNYSKCKMNIFHPVKFVEENVSNTVINIDKKLSIETAPRYFVTNYVQLKQLRYHMSSRYKFGLFFSQRIKDSLRTLPLTFTKCFFTIPI